MSYASLHHSVIVTHLVQGMTTPIAPDLDLDPEGWEAAQELRCALVFALDS